MKFLAAAFLIFCASTSAQAASLMLDSHPEQQTDLAGIPRTLVEEMVSAGAEASGSTFSGSAKAAVQIVAASGVSCEKSGNESPVCQIQVGNGAEKKQVQVAAPEILFSALKRVHQDKDGIELGACEANGNCHLTASRLYCLVNTDFAEATAGKYSCGIIGG